MSAAYLVSRTPIAAPVARKTQVRLPITQKPGVELVGSTRLDWLADP
ncbi:hypothetical protein N9L76_05790 [bacterium]|nr:hypothetical protein [bacterium]